MENYTKNNLWIFILNFTFSFSIAGTLLFHTNVAVYKKVLAEKIFIIAFAENAKTADKASLQIRKIKGVRKVRVEPPEKTTAKLYQDIKKKEFLAELPKISIPVVIKIYLKETDFSLFKRVTGEISRIREIKQVDGGGQSVRSIFIFIEKLKKISRLIIALLLFICAASGILVRTGLKTIDERFLFLTERNLDKTQILLHHIPSLVLPPLVSAMLTVLLLVLLWQGAAGSGLLFLGPVQILIVFILSNIPALSLIIKK